ncbi:PREDICTED: agamous-like MADS-box protein AGL29 [Lupinus angustifolius]|nr:PREDICTED: agamous-like MADS-box protein AGL29 [Lupinus angustifolius]
MSHRKIEMKLMENKSSRLVTFSKRKSGLFKKAMELSILCGVEVVVLLFSVGGKAYSFGHPSIEAVTKKFLHQGEGSHVSHGESSNDDGNIGKLSHQLQELKDQIQVEKDKKKELDKALSKYKFINGKLPIDNLSFEELVEFKASLVEAQDNMPASNDELEVASSLLLFRENRMYETGI